MWPTNRGYMNSAKPTANPPQQQSSVDTNQLLLAADSLRTLLGDDISSTILQSIRDNPTDRMNTSLPQMTSRRPTERNVIEYESPNYSRLDRSRLSQMTSDFGSSDQRFNDSPPLKTETQIYDPTKMPQKSILKKSRDQSFESANFHSIEEEDLYLYGNPSTSSSGILPPGIVTLEQQSERSPSNERPLSPISLRLKREMEKMDRSRRQTEPNEDNHWTPRLGMNASAEEPIYRNWNDEEEEVFKRRYRDLKNPSPDRSLELEKLRIQQLAAIQAGILTHSDKTTKRRDLSPDSPLRNSDYSTYRRNSPEMDPKRVRRRSPSISPRRRRSKSPRRRSRSPRKRSSSPRRRSISPRNRRGYRSRSRSRDRYRRSRSRSRTPPRRRSPNPLNPTMNLINPMPPMMRMTAPGMPFMPPHHNLVGMPMGPIMGQYLPPPPPMGARFQTFVPQNIRPNIVNNISPQRPALRKSPISTSPSAQTSKKPTEKKDDKLLNPLDLLVAERAKLRDELETLKKQYQRKKEEQEVVVKKDGGTDSYSFRHLDKVIKELRDAIESKHDKLVKNFELINEVQKSKSKAKEVMEQLKTSGDISKVDLKKKESANKSKAPTLKKTKSPDKKSDKEQSKQDKKEEEEDEEDEKNSRFHYFDSGPHWCKDCNKFLENMKQYFIHIHSKDHLSKQKETLKTPWITKEYIKQIDKQVPKNKDQLVVASKGIHFILPTHGFFCELCKQFFNDSYQAEKHFKSAKHNRSYTRYTLLHNEYEHKWKAERDKAFTEIKRKERELEKEKSKREAEKKIEDRKRLEEEVKRKDREVKEKIEAMNKSLKTVKELDDPKTIDHKKDDKNKSSPKSSIRLNLSSSKTSNESNDKSKSSEKSDDKRDKSKEKSDEKTNKLKKSNESMDGMEDMLIIDEINCDSLENNEIQESNENVDENALLFPNNSENNSNTNSESNENKTENNNKSVENIVEVMVTSVEKQNKQINEEKENSAQNESNDKNEESSDPIEGVDPQINENSNSNAVTTEITVSEQISEENLESKDESNHKTNSEDKTSDEMVSKVKENSEMTESTDPSNCNDTQTMAQTLALCPDAGHKTYAEAVKGSDGSKPEEMDKNPFKLEDMDIKSVKLEDKSEERVENNGSVETENTENENKSVLLDTNTIKTENMFDIDLDIENFNERLRNLDSMVKKESIDTEADDEDPLDGFDVIDETNNEDNNRITQEVIDLSD